MKAQEFLKEACTQSNTSYSGAKTGFQLPFVDSGLRFKQHNDFMYAFEFNNIVIDQYRPSDVSLRLHVVIEATAFNEIFGDYGIFMNNGAVTEYLQRRNAPFRIQRQSVRGNEDITFIILEFVSIDYICFNDSKMTPTEEYFDGLAKNFLNSLYSAKINSVLSGE